MRSAGEDTPFAPGARVAWRALALCAALVLPLQSASAHHDTIPDPPPRSTEARLPAGLDLDASSVTVSGLSSGAFFAHQFHVAHSSLVSGAGIVAGGPYGCVEVVANPFWPRRDLAPAAAATVACTHYVSDRFLGLRPEPPSAERVLSLIADTARRGLIDDPAGLASSRVWLFRGSVDGVVPAGVAATLAEVYRALGVAGANLQIGEEEPGNPAGHGMPVERFVGESRFAPRACSERAPPYIVECGFDAAGLLLRHLYAEDFHEAPADAHDAGTLAAFSQAEFLEIEGASVGLSGVGYVYVPSACIGMRCRLHVAFHGCRQNADARGAERVHDDFVRDAGYNRWAAANGIVVLYPQATQSPGNPNACWDFWGYSGPGYRDRRGPQMRAVRAMIDRLLEP